MRKGDRTCGILASEPQCAWHEEGEGSNASDGQFNTLKHQMRPNLAKSKGERGARIFQPSFWLFFLARQAARQEKPLVSPEGKSRSDIIWRVQQQFQGLPGLASPPLHGTAHGTHAKKTALKAQACLDHAHVISINPSSLSSVLPTPLSSTSKDIICSTVVKRSKVR
jgi:hypothetical protein